MMKMNEKSVVDMTDEEFDQYMKKIEDRTLEALETIKYHPVYTMLDDIMVESEKLRNE